MPPPAPARPALLVVDPNDERRRALAVGLSERGYEAVPTISAAEGLRFARARGPAGVVAPGARAAAGGGALRDDLRRAGSGARTLLLLGESEAEGEELAEELRLLAVGGLDDEELVRRVRLLLFGRELGAEPDPGLTSLVGELALLPPLELVRTLGRLGASGSIELDHGAYIEMDAGRVVSASVGAARGAKAFCRLARRRDGPFRVRLGAPPPSVAEDPAAIHSELNPLLIEAIEDVVVGAPDGRLQVQRVGAPDSADEVVRAILSLVDQADAEGSPITAAAILDRLPFRDGQIHDTLLELVEQGAVAFVEPQSKVRVVTDSTADLPLELAQSHGIQVVPLRVLFGKVTLKDGVDVTPQSFYERLAKSNVHPSTTPPPPADFLATYKALVARSDVVSVHISGKMSLTAAEAGKALAVGAEALAALRRDGTPQVEIVDSRSVSLGLGLQALFAARMAVRGLSASAIAERLVSIRERVFALFVVDTLEYLARGGRIGKARALVGGLLGIKPILGVVDGEVTAVDKVRGGRRAHPRILELFTERIDPHRPVIGGVVHANAPMWADRLRGLLQENLQIQELLLAEIGPVVGTHAGPGTVGAALYQPEDPAELALLAPLAS